MINKTLTKTSILAMALLIGGIGVTSVYAFGPKLASLTNDQKAIFDTMHNLRMSGDIEGAQALAQEMGFRGGRGASRNQHREETMTAVESNDYNAFLVATKDSPMEGRVTAEIFVQMVKAHSLRNSGDIDGAREIMQGLGIGKGKEQVLGGERQWRGMNRGGEERRNWSK